MSASSDPFARVAKGNKLAWIAASAAMLTGCGSTPAPNSTEATAALLTAREGSPMEIHAIAEKRADGHIVVCGFYGPPPSNGRSLSNRFTTIDGKLVNLIAPAFQVLVDECRAEFATAPAIYD